MRYGVAGDNPYCSGLVTCPALIAFAPTWRSGSVGGRQQSSRCRSRIGRAMAVAGAGVREIDLRDNA
jgi:hypothetical protein